VKNALSALSPSPNTSPHRNYNSGIQTHAGRNRCAGLNTKSRIKNRPESGPRARSGSEGLRGPHLPVGLRYWKMNPWRIDAEFELCVTMTLVEPIGRR